MNGIQPELYIERAAAAVSFYEEAFGARVVHRVGLGDDIVAQLAVGDGLFWVSTASPDRRRLSPDSIDGATGRTLLVVADPKALLEQALAAGGRELSPVCEEHGWLLGRILDPFGHEWEIGTPMTTWPPTRTTSTLD